MSEAQPEKTSVLALINTTPHIRGTPSLGGRSVLVWSEYFDRITDGIAAERQIKGWSRAKKEALMCSDWDKVSDLSRRRGGRPKEG
jgi:hypothetical protein